MFQALPCHVQLPQPTKWWVQNIPGGVGSSHFGREKKADQTCVGGWGLGVSGLVVSPCPSPTNPCLPCPSAATRLESWKTPR